MTACAALRKTACTRRRRVGVAVAAMGLSPLAAVPAQATVSADAAHVPGRVGAAGSLLRTAGASAVPAAYTAAVSTPKVDSYYPDHGNAVVDALHYKLDLTWQPKLRALTGREQLVFRAAKSSGTITLDLSDALNVTSAVVDGQPVTATHTQDHLQLPVPVTAAGVHTVVLSYAGVPKPVAAPGTRSDASANGFFSKADGRAYTMQEPYGAFTWYAVNDQPADKALYDFTLHVPAPFVGIANGKLTSRHTVGGVATTHWHLSSPAASYLTTVAFGNYRHTSLGKVNGTPISYWTPVSRPKLARRLRFMKPDFAWLEKQLGAYPFDTLSLVVVPSASAMETQTMVTEGSTSYPLLEHNIVHEMSHQWYGDLVTPNDWRDVWMSEGMATYIEELWEDKSLGYRPGSMVQIDSRGDQGLRSRYGAPGAYNPDDFASGNVYYPPARMWWKLSRKLGKTTFTKLMRRWPTSHAVTSQSREALENWWSKKAGRDLHPFFSSWLLGARDPS